jgi:hypothetical protein
MKPSSFVTRIAPLQAILGGIGIVESPLLFDRDVQIRFPIHRKRRVMKKWAKRDCNWRMRPSMYKMGNTLYAHPHDCLGAPRGTSNSG